MTPSTDRPTRRKLLSVLADLACAVLAGVSFSASPEAASLEEIKKRGYMLVVTEDDYRPFEFVKDGEPTGFDNELLEELRKYVPFEVRQEIIPWTGLLAGVSTGKYDVAVTAAIITKERDKSLDFTMPIADATHYFVKRKGDDSIKEIKDLDGKALGVQAGSALLARLPELAGMLEKTGGKLGKVVEYTSYPEAYQDLALKRTDYVVNSFIGIKALVTEKPDVFEIGLPVSGKSYPAWAVAEGNSELQALLNEFMLAKRADGTIPKLQEKWFGQTWPDLPTSFTPEF